MKKTIKAAIALVLTFALAITVTYAWFSGTASYSKFGSGELGNLQVLITRENNVEVNDEIQRIAYELDMSEMQPRDTVEVKTGESITYSMEISLTEANPAPEKISVRFSSLSDYLFNGTLAAYCAQQYAQDETAPFPSLTTVIDDRGTADVSDDLRLRNIFAQGSARLIYRLTGLSAEVKNISDNTTVTTYAFDSGETEFFPYGNTFNLWKISDEEYFVSGIPLQAGQKLLVNFDIMYAGSTMDYSDFAAAVRQDGLYMEDFDDLFTSLGIVHTSEFVDWYANNLVSKEIECICTSTSALTFSLKFEIDSIQQPRNGRAYTV